MLTRSIQATFVSLIVLFYAQTAVSESLSFENILNQAISHSYDRQIFREEVLAAKAAAVREAQSSYYPQLAVRFGNDYIYSYTDGNEIIAGSDIVIAKQPSYGLGNAMTVWIRTLDELKSVCLANLPRLHGSLLPYSKPAHWKKATHLILPLIDRVTLSLSGVNLTVIFGMFGRKDLSNSLHLFQGIIAERIPGASHRFIRQVSTGAVESWCEIGIYVSGINMWRAL